MFESVMLIPCANIGRSASVNPCQPWRSTAGAPIKKPAIQTQQNSHTVSMSSSE
jgi:hypothetical protein